MDLLDLSFFERLHQEGGISDASFEKLNAKREPSLISVHWELKSLLYLGVLLLSTGLGILIYKNIDYIGHRVVLGCIALISAGGFIYCFRNKLPFSQAKVGSPNLFFDYILLLACLSFVSFLGYWQYQYHIFGDRYGLATFIPTLVLFFIAYFFDQLGILSLAITSLAAWVGIVVTPARILQANDFSSQNIILTGIALGLVLVAAGKTSSRTALKPHFAFTYMNFGMNILFISALAALFYFDETYLLWFLLLTGIATFFYLEAVRERSFYFLLMLTLYFYIGLSYTILRLLFYTLKMPDSSWFLGFTYFIGSAIGLIFFLIRMNKKLK